MAVTVLGAITNINSAHRGLGVGYLYEAVPTVAHAAATATEYIGQWVAPHDCRLRAVYFLPLAAVTGANTNTTHLNVINVGVAAGTTELANLDLTSTNNLTGRAKNVITQALTTDLSAGDVIALEAEKVGTGLDVPAGVMFIAYDGG